MSTKGKRRCYVCKKEKLYSEFNKGAKGELKLRYSCRECDREAKVEYRRRKGYNVTGKRGRPKGSRNKADKIAKILEISRIKDIRKTVPLITKTSKTKLSFKDRLELIRDLAIEYRLEKDYSFRIDEIIQDDTLLLDPEFYNFS